MIVFSAISFLVLLPFAVFGVIAAVVWLVLSRVVADPSRAEQRLDVFRDPTARQKGDKAGAKETSAVAKVLEKASPALARPLQPKSATEANKLKLRLSHAGFRSESAPTVFLGLKLAALIVGVVLGGGTAFSLTGMSQKTIIQVVLYAGGMFYLPTVIVWFLAKRRKDALFLGLPDALDLLVVCVEAGLALDQAMRRVAEEMKKSYRLLSNEFSLSNLQLQMGRPRSEVLRELGQRTGMEDLQSLASILIQADKFGSSIAQALRVQSDAMRTRRSQIAEEKAAKTAVQLIFPLVLFIFPGIFVVLVGPAAITRIRQMLPMMGGAQ